MILKLDMEKAFDRVEGHFLKEVMVRFGFDQKVIKMVARCIEKAHYSVLFNGVTRGDFTSTRGLKQGDPLSPYLFILALEVLSRGLLREFQEERICPYYSPRKCKQVTHLLCTDDTLIFLNGRSLSLEGCIDFLEEYYLASGQKINTGMSSFIVGKNAPPSRAATIGRITGYSQANTEFPFEYLGMPIFQGRTRISHFSKLMNKIRKRIDG